jgi:hypothetical protein
MSRRRAAVTKIELPPLAKGPRPPRSRKIEWEVGNLNLDEWSWGCGRAGEELNADDQPLANVLGDACQVRLDARMRIIPFHARSFDFGSLASNYCSSVAFPTTIYVTRLV